MDLLKQLVIEIVQASPEYMKKERVREAIQQVIVGLVSSGDIKSNEELQNFFSSADMSLKALKMIPFSTYATIAGKPPK